MSERAARATRRTIRKAFGGEALDVIDTQGAALQQTVLPALKNHQLAIDTIGARLDTVSGLFHDFRTMTRWQRLRWVLGF
jgi:hypothetical protein